MKRTLILSIAALGLCCCGLAACGNESEQAASDLGVQEGRRPVPDSKRKPPGPPDPMVVTEEESGQKAPEGEQPGGDE